MVVPTSHMRCQTVWYAVIYILVGCWYLLTNHVATIARIFKDCRLLGCEVKQYGMQLSTFWRDDGTQLQTNLATKARRLKSSYSDKTGMENSKCVHQNVASMTGVTFNNNTITHAVKQHSSHSCHH